MLNISILKIYLLSLALVLCTYAKAQDTTHIQLSDTLQFTQDSTQFLNDSVLSLDDSLKYKQDSTIPIGRYANVELNLDSAKIYYFHNNFEQLGPDFMKMIDTVITGVQKYDPPEKPGNYYATLGNPGLAHANMVYSPSIKSGFDFGIRSFDKYKFHTDSLQYYWIGKPYTHLYYIMGSKKEQNLHVGHSQDVSSWFNIGLNFRYVHSPGYYKNQKGDDKNFAIKTRFQAWDYRYIALASYVHNKLKMDENGGIVYDSIFEENTITSREGIPINLSTAQNSFIENSFYVKQLFKLTKRKRFNANDTTSYATIFDRLNPGNISHSIHISREKWFYDQELSDNNGYYQNTYDSLNKTHDSTFTYKIENQLSWTNADNAKYQFLSFNFGIKHLYIEHSVDSTRNIYNQIIPNGMINLRFTKFMNVTAYGDFVSGNTNVGDFNLYGQIKFDTEYGSLTYKLQTALQEPGNFYRHYKSNHFVWENDFVKQSFFINKVDFHYKTFWAGLNAMNVGNLVYMDSLSYPAQLDNSVQILQITARKLFNFWDLSLDTRIIYQKSSNRNGLRLPDFIGDVSFYYTKALFKEAAIIQPGIDVFYNTPYKAYAWMPATRSFYIQNQKELGNYFYINAYFNLQIKRSRIFVRYTNLGHLFGNYSYMTVPSYPMKDGGMRFGISWMFYD
jgi:hypothetical protein